MPPTASPDVQAETGADLLRTILDSQTLLMGCIAFALLALLAVARVSARRRQDRNIRRESHAQTQAMHAFLEMVRAGVGSTEQGVWHYDFTTGAQQFSDEFSALVGSEDALKTSGIDLARLARQHSDMVVPYEARLELAALEGTPRSFTFQACNIRNGEGQVQRAVAIVREIEAQIEQAAGSD